MTQKLHDTPDGKLSGIFPDQSALAAFCRRRHIRKLSLFGSRLYGTNRPDSDYDFLVEYEVGKTPGLIGFLEAQYELSDLLGGAKIDLNTPNSLGPNLRDKILNSAAVQYGG
ncbi:MAG: nucleotidyltransferase domain-containing protein [Candidatus Symbiobacter sp.]|nr:nucleotidyltransferase domain-containing protein [Candidatus Symbiobacter sp.]